MAASRKWSLSMINVYVVPMLSRVQPVEIASIQSARSRGFGFITMSTVDEAARCIEKLNGIVCYWLNHGLGLI